MVISVRVGIETTMDEQTAVFLLINVRRQANWCAADLVDESRDWGEGERRHSLTYTALYRYILWKHPELGETEEADGKKRGTRRMYLRLRYFLFVSKEQLRVIVADATMTTDADARHNRCRADAIARQSYWFSFFFIMRFTESSSWSKNALSSQQGKQLSHSCKCMETMDEVVLLFKLPLCSVALSIKQRPVWPI